MTTSPIADILSELTRLRSALPERCREDWAAAHDWEWENEPIAYVHPASDGAGHAAILTTTGGDFRNVETEEYEGERRNYDRVGQTITQYVAALHNALPVLAGLAKENADLRQLIGAQRILIDGRPLDADKTPNADEISRFKCGGPTMVSAVKDYRFRSGLGLPEAKKALELAASEDCQP